IATIYDMVGEEGFGHVLQRYRQSLNAGILKVMSKMGISTLNSYRGAQIFEAIGISDSLIQQCFTGTPSLIGGIGFEGIEADVLRFHRDAFGGDEPAELEDRGYYRFRNTGEYHAFNPFVFKALHKAVRSGKYEDYRVYAQLVETRPPATLRDLLEVKQAGTPIPIEEVEPVELIVRRFVASGMSHGALSREAHETIAIAMNRLGAKSNSGEGGEDPTRYHRRPNGDWPNSVIKQVASARFGVTPDYLASAKELEIKMAQGSKPGEGGQLPGHKVSEEIAFIRHSVPGVTLISPPPHHDIYSIEDIAQLIYDLKHINPRAKVCVKLVAEAGVGTIAAGVAKAYADVILISGHEGGTGASPVSSIKHAGGIGELGLAETQQVLVLNGLRGRVTLRTDGGLKTGRDVVISALLGAEEFGFGTATVVAAGCVMARQCHLNTCPVGVATQDERLRSRFSGRPEMVVNFFTLIAQEVREILAQLGFRTLDEVIGRTDLLMSKDLSDHYKAKYLDLRPIFAQIDPSWTQPRHHIKERNDRIDAPLDDSILQDAKDAIAENTSIVLNYEVRNVHRAVGAKLSGEIAFHYGDKGLDGVIECRFRGSAGQSFGAFAIRGMRLVLIGEANDYVGKGMAGGEIILRPPKEARFAPHENIIMGNTVMYGATGGALYAAGRAGERFCVRNSGGRAVVDGVGDHGCEYMTGGVVVILGGTGRNFGAGMTGGVAYVLDEHRNFPERCNLQLVGLERVTSEEDVDLLQSMIGRHLETTNSRRSGEILSRWEEYLPLFWKVVPHLPPSVKSVKDILAERRAAVAVGR
ncbi:MAG: glutamate synthase large subunit, partial [Candidatus Latescibacteria bacterium]|nr:glutamate synthase large subunit [Candidatus Latescibacterota bacterium]